MPAKPALLSRFKTHAQVWQDQRRITSLAAQVSARARPDPALPRVAFFNASSRLSGLSLNAAFSLLSGWGLRLAGVPVVHFACEGGMSRCVLGLNREDFSAPPPCAACISQSRRLHAGAEVHWFRYAQEAGLAEHLKTLTVPEMAAVEVPFRPGAPFSGDGISPDAPGEALPLGELVLPALRWALRRHHLPDDEPTRGIFREYLLSAYHIACQFSQFLDAVQPAVLVVFNGIMYPEATARWVARRRGLPVITHEVGFQRFSAFFSPGQATAYPMDIPAGFQLSPGQNECLDRYLEKRFQGQFTMAGIRFWPEMRGLDEAFLARAAQFRQMVPVFTNVIFDTSQVHANSLFPHMFAWLDAVLEIIRAHPETLFVVRAHPDEMRPGTAKQSRESVQDWLHQNGADQLPNLVFIAPQEYISSYELIQRARFVMVYNSSIGLEAALMGAPVLCAGKARYTQIPIVFFPESQAAFRDQAEDFLNGEAIHIPPDFRENARRFLYYQLFRTSLPFERYLEAGSRPGYVRLRHFSWRDLLPENSPTIQVLVNSLLGRTLLGQAPFQLETCRINPDEGNRR